MNLKKLFVLVYVALGIGLIGALSLQWSGRYYMEKIVEGYKVVSDHDAPMLDELVSVTRHLGNLRGRALTAMMHTDLQAKDKAGVTVDESAKQIEEGITKLRDKFISEEGKKLASEALPMLKEYHSALKTAIQLSKDGDLNVVNSYNASNARPAYERFRDKLEELGDFIQTRTREHADIANAFFDSAKKTTLILGVIICGIILTACAGIYFASRAVSASVLNVATQLNTSSEQTASAAGQISSTSQSLAEGASQQAASLEETSSSLEEMTSMTKRNAENAQTAQKLAEETNKAALSGAEAMREMSTAMSEISRSSSDIAKIIKTIDEIALQTNILALNAAVEAARAGDAGMGFAVVADEVRSLAMRSAQAAKETAEKIHDSVQKSTQGVEISTKVDRSLSGILESMRRVNELVNEIATASVEQNQGIGQINMAVSQMDKVTQANASNAEEAASASEELSSQAESLREAVQYLIQTLGEQKNHSNSEPTRTTTRPSLKRPTLASPKPAPLKLSATNPQTSIPLEQSFSG